MNQSRLFFCAAVFVTAIALAPSPLWPQQGEQNDGGAVGQGRSSTGIKIDIEEIKKLQQALKEKGHDPGPINGEMSAKTEAAMKAFQQKHGLEATGVPDAQTRAALGRPAGDVTKSGSGVPATQGPPRGTGVEPVVPDKPTFPVEIPAK